MSEESSPQERGFESERSGVRDQLRTIAFRLREIQRLLSMQVQQENRWLEAEGLEPVTEATFFKRRERPREISKDSIARLVETLGDFDLGDDARITLLDNTTITGAVGPIDYVPRGRLRVELRPDEDSTLRYELKTEHGDETWNSIRVRKYKAGDEDWTALSQVMAVEPRS